MKSIFLLSFASVFSSASAQCLSIAELVCRVSSLSTLCSFITQAGLQSRLSVGNWTLFAPTNTAFFKIGQALAEISNSTDALSVLILYHAVDGPPLYVANLNCSGTVQMASGQTSRTECQDDNTYQLGQGNDPDEMPQIVAKNINACNGLLHIVDEVLLPTTDFVPAPVPQVATSDCKTITDIVCDSSILSTLCTSLQQTGTDVVLAEGDDFTLFAPTNEAFTNLGDDALGSIAQDTDLLAIIVLHHIAGEVLSESDLPCGASLPMTSGSSTTTVCRDNALFQTGFANEQGMLPEVVLPDILACNGRIHLVNQVILPELSEPQQDTPTAPCQSISPRFFSTLNKHAWTVFAPTNEAFANLGGTFDAVLEDRNILHDILLYHTVDQVIDATELKCSGKMNMLDGTNTRTLCVNDTIFQVGGGNDWDALPRILSVDNQVCNGVLYRVDQVILPELS